MQGYVDSQESLTGEDRPELSGTTKEVTKRNNTDHILDRLINWQYLLPPIKLFYTDTGYVCTSSVASKRAVIEQLAKILFWKKCLSVSDVHQRIVVIV